MKIKEVSYSLKRTISKDYQSFTPQVGAVIEVGNGTPEMAYKIATSFVEKKMKEKIEKIKEVI